VPSTIYWGKRKEFEIQLMREFQALFIFLYPTLYY